MLCWYKKECPHFCLSFPIIFLISCFWCFNPKKVPEKVLVAFHVVGVSFLLLVIYLSVFGTSNLFVRVFALIVSVVEAFEITMKYLKLKKKKFQPIIYKPNQK